MCVSCSVQINVHLYVQDAHMFAAVHRQGYDKTTFMRILTEQTLLGVEMCTGSCGFERGLDTFMKDRSIHGSCCLEGVVLKNISSSPFSPRPKTDHTVQAMYP